MVCTPPLTPRRDQDHQAGVLEMEQPQADVAPSGCRRQGSQRRGGARPQRWVGARPPQPRTSQDDGREEHPVGT